LLSHGFERFVTADHGEGLDLVHLGAGLDDREDLDAVDVELGIGLDDVAGLAPRRENRTVEDTLGLTRAGGSPRPGAVGARTRQLDLDPAGHGS